MSVKMMDFNGFLGAVGAHQGPSGGPKLGPISSSPLRVQNQLPRPPETTPQSPPRTTMVPKVFSNSASLKSCLGY